MNHTFEVGIYVYRGDVTCFFPQFRRTFWPFTYSKAFINDIVMDKYSIANLNENQIRYSIWMDCVIKAYYITG